MKWTPGLTALVTGLGFLALVAVGVGYLMSADPQGASLARAAPTRGARSSGSPTSGSPTAASPSGRATTLDPGSGITMVASPMPTAKPKRKRAHRHVAPPLLPLPVPLPTLDFALSSFNVLGANHTSSRGKRLGMASGRVRAHGAAELIRRHGADVVGFQELQGPQLSVLQGVTGMDFYPGFSLCRLDTDNSIGWRRDRWVAVEKHTVNIPYFNGGARAMPFVRLRSVSTGIEAWFANFHNPAETAQYRHQQRFRSRATRIETHLANRLIGTGLPVFITGDMNERASYFCRLTASAPMVAARGGSNNGRCLAGHPRAVDWIFGSRGVDFTGYEEDRSHLVDITTDHPVLTARVHLVGKARAH